MIAAVQQQQDSNALSPTPQHKAISRAPSPVPSAVYTSSTNQVLNNSSPKLPLPRRSSFSTEVSTGDVYEEKPLITQRSFPHLPTSKKHRNNKKKSSRRGSDATTTSNTTTTDDNLGFSDSGVQGGGANSMTNLSTVTATTTNTVFANEKRNHDFHTLFRSVPENERLIDDYGCALQKEILLQGRVYISENHLCFNANIFGWITNLVIAFADIEDIEKRSTAIFIPNAILISTCSSKHFLASFLSRDTAYDQMVEIWKQSRANTSQIEVHHHDKFNDDATAYSDEDNESDFTTSSGYSYTDEDEDSLEEEEERSEAADQVNGTLNNGQDKAQGDRQGSLASLPIPKHISNDAATAAAEAARRRAVSEAGPRPNMQDYLKSHKSEPHTSTLKSHDVSATTEAINTETPITGVAVMTKASQQLRGKTDCECSKNDQHFPTVVMDNKYDTTIESMYNILFNSSFMNKFLCEVEKSTEVCIGEWCKGNDTVYSRESSYIKYLGGSIGPKSTKCYLKEDVLHFDTSDYISQLTVTQTPDVPSGGSFSVKTRTCISWCGQGQVRVLVTVLVDFTKSSWLKSTIEKASIDGQQNYYKSLDVAVRKYLDEQQASEKANHGGKKKSKRGRRHRHRSKEEKNQHEQPAMPAAPAPKQHVVVEVLSSILNWCIDNASMPNTSQLTAFCMGLMVITNIYIASKMAGVDKQLIQLGGQVRGQPASAEHYYQKDVVDDNNSLWKLLSKLDPDARKEDLRFVHHTRQPVQHQDYQQYHNKNKEKEEEEDVFDENLEFSQMAKIKLDKQMMELEKMIQKAGQSMEQVTQVVQSQRQRILNPEWK